jgi:transposase
MNVVEYIGLDVHKKSISICAKVASGEIVEEGKLKANRVELMRWVESRRHPFVAGLEATIFTGWIYDFLKPHAREVKVINPLLAKAITAGKRKNDQLDARQMADMLRVDWVPECYMAPPEIRDLRRVLRYRNLVVREATRFKNRTSGLLMECGIEHTKSKVHQAAYFESLLGSLPEQVGEVPESLVGLLKMSHRMVEMLETTSKWLAGTLAKHPRLKARVKLLETIAGVGPVLALTWVLEVGEVERFGSIAKAISYCGLCSGESQSGERSYRGPISKQRNPHLQSVLVEVAHLAPRWNPQLKEVYEKELTRGHRNRATLAVARKLVAYLMAVDKSGKPFEPRVAEAAAVAG